jgi:hypothetical protein
VEKNEVSLMMTLAVCLERISRLQCREREPRWRPVGYLNCKSRAGKAEFRKPWRPKVAEQNTTEEAVKGRRRES